MRRRWSTLAVLGVVAVGCGPDVRRFPLREPMWVDDDTRPVWVECVPNPDPKPDDPKELCRPEEYESPFAWDVADKTVFRPLTQLFYADVGFQAQNVNAFDEVPDSSWFQNRIGRQPMSVDEFVSGPCGKPLNPDAEDGAWLVDMGKPNGANPGFRVNVKGVGKFMLKADPKGEGERATGATAIASRLYHAMGYWSACDTVLHFRPSILKLKPGLKFADNSGVEKTFDQAALDSVLENAVHRGELVRMVASEWLPGRTIGPWRYEDTRSDNPNDVIPHQERRELRGGRVIAAWLNHFDSREQNTMGVWLSTDKENKDASPGHVRHYLIDLGDCFGSEWDWDAISRRLGHSYYLDLGHVSSDFLTLGIITRPWDRAKRSKEGDIFGYFNGENFEPHDWHGGYPNPSFQRMDEGDGAWAARILANIGPEHVEAAVKVGDYTEPRHTKFLVDALLVRRKKILERYMSERSPITDVRATGDQICAVDLAKREGIFADKKYAYSAAIYSGSFDAPTKVAVKPAAAGEICMTLPRVAGDGGAAPGDASRYAVVDVANGVAEGVLRLHFYDLGPAKGFKLVGIERPDDDDAP